MKIARVSKIAAISFAGFVVATLVADKVNMGPVVSQTAGFLGGIVGTLVGRRNTRGESDAPVTKSGQPRTRE